MSRVFYVTSLVMAMSYCVLTSERASAQFALNAVTGESHSTPQKEQAKQDDSTTVSNSKAEEKIEAALNESLKSPIQYQDQPLNEVINMLQEEYDIPILFDHAALEGEAISPDTEISINLRNISLRSTLDLILRQPGLEYLTYLVTEEALLITTEEKANATLVVQVYRVDDLVNNYSQQSGGDQKNPYSSLIQVITSCVVSDSWMANGSGVGEIKLMHPGMLVVTQTWRVQEQVQELLDKLRDTQAEIEGE